MEKNIFKKLAYAGVGLAILGKRKAEEFAREVGEKLEIPEEEINTYLDKLSLEAEKVKGEMEAKIKDQVQEYLRKAEVPDKKEIEELKARISILEAKLAETKGR